MFVTILHTRLSVGPGQANTVVSVNFPRMLVTFVLIDSFPELFRIKFYSSVFSLPFIASSNQEQHRERESVLFQIPSSS
jgi:hypothetical protein